MKIITIIMALALLGCANQPFHYRGKLALKRADLIYRAESGRNAYPVYPVYVP